jgi:hypothetical protein
LKASIFAGSGRRQAAKISTRITLPLALFIFFFNERSKYGQWANGLKISKLVWSFSTR